MLKSTRDFDGARECPTLDGMPGFHEVCVWVKDEKKKGEFTLVMSRATWRQPGVSASMAAPLVSPWYISSVCNRAAKGVPT